MHLITTVVVFASVCFLADSRSYEKASTYQKASERFVEVSRNKRQTTGPLDCGGNYTAPIGYFHSPGFPIDYVASAECEWYIKVFPPYVKIRLEFVPMLSLHSFIADDGERWCYDYVKVHDGNSADAPYELWCGHGIAVPIVSSGDSLYLKFFSDSYETSHRGFLAIYAGITAEGTTECVDLKKMVEPTTMPENAEEKPMA